MFFEKRQKKIIVTRDIDKVKRYSERNKKIFNYFFKLSIKSKKAKEIHFGSETSVVPILPNELDYEKNE